jgi:hypothetical protein
MLDYFAAACQVKGVTILPPWYKYLDSETISGRCTPRFAFPDDISRILLALTEILLRVGALVAVGFIIYGGFQYLISQGEPDRTKAARQTIQNAVIGLVITTLATFIVNFVGGRLTA